MISPVIERTGSAIASTWKMVKNEHEDQGREKTDVELSAKAPLFLDRKFNPTFLPTHLIHLQSLFSDP
jgi:hypothetical protein